MDDAARHGKRDGTVESLRSARPDIVGALERPRRLARIGNVHTLVKDAHAGTPDCVDGDRVQDRRIDIEMRKLACCQRAVQELHRGAPFDLAHIYAVFSRRFQHFLCVALATVVMQRSGDEGRFFVRTPTPRQRHGQRGHAQAVVGEHR